MSNVIDELIKEQILEDQYQKAIYELSSYSVDVFNKVMEQLFRNPDNKHIKDTFEDNLQTAIKSILTLRKNKNKSPSVEVLLSCNTLLSSLGEYLDKFSYEGKLSEQVRRTFLILHDYLEHLPERTVKEHSESKKYDSKQIPESPNAQYLMYYEEYFKENFHRAKVGLKILDKVEDWAIDVNCPLGEIQSLALEDSLKHLRSGIDQRTSRGNLEFYFGNLSRSELSDRKMLSGVSKLLDDINSKRAKQILFLEGLSETELSQDNWLNKRIVELIKKRR